MYVRAVAVRTYRSFRPVEDETYRLVSLSNTLSEKTLCFPGRRKDVEGVGKENGWQGQSAIHTNSTLVNIQGEGKLHRSTQTELGEGSGG